MATKNQKRGEIVRRGAAAADDVDYFALLPAEVVMLVFSNLSLKELVAAIPTVNRRFRATAAITIQDILQKNPHRVYALWENAGHAMPTDKGYYNWLTDTLPPIRFNPVIFEHLLKHHNVIGYEWARTKWAHTDSGGQPLDMAPYMRPETMHPAMFPTIAFLCNEYERWLRMDDPYMLMLDAIGYVWSFLANCCAYDAVNLMEWTIRHLTAEQRTRLRTEFPIARLSESRKDCRGVLDAYQHATHMSDIDIAIELNYQYNGTNLYMWAWLTRKYPRIVMTRLAKTRINKECGDFYRDNTLDLDKLPLDVMDALIKAFGYNDVIYNWVVKAASAKQLEYLCTTKKHKAGVLTVMDLICEKMAKLLKPEQIRRCIDGLGNPRCYNRKIVYEDFLLDIINVDLDTARWIVKEFPMGDGEPKPTRVVSTFQGVICEMTNPVAKIDFILENYTLKPSFPGMPVRINPEFALFNYGLPELKHLMKRGLLDITPGDIAAYAASFFANARAMPASFIYDRCVWLTEEHGIELDRKALVDLTSYYYTYNSETYEVALKLIARFGLRSALAERMRQEPPAVDPAIYTAALARLDR